MKKQKNTSNSVANTSPPLIGIVMPTYNEAQNILRVLREIRREERSKKNREGRQARIIVLVVDDSSPDGTADLVAKYRKKDSRVQLLVRKKKEGLGAAYIHGIKYLIEKENPHIIFEMDADGQHNPKDILRMVDEIYRGSDFVIGSRYIENGSVSSEWKFHRKVVSYLARKAVGIGLGLGSVRDASSGFRAIHSRVFDRVDLDQLSVSGYSFQAAFLEAVVRNKFTVTEIPISFEARRDGKSKMRIADAMEGWKLIFQVRMQRAKAGVTKLLRQEN